LRGAKRKILLRQWFMMFLVHLGWLQWLSIQAFMLIRNWRTRFCSRMKTCAAGMRSASSFTNQEDASTALSDELLSTIKKRAEMSSVRLRMSPRPYQHATG